MESLEEKKEETKMFLEKLKIKLGSRECEDRRKKEGMRTESNVVIISSS